MTTVENRLTLDTDTEVFFYEADHYYLSSFSAFSVEIWGYTFPTAEHAYHWRKFCPNFESGYSGNEEHCQNIRMATSAHEAFCYAQEHSDARNPQWDEIKFDQMFQIVLAKTEQHEYIQTKLPKTGERTLIENSWRDDFWGWGPQRDGQNRLGKIWMKVRSMLKAQASPWFIPGRTVDDF